MTNLVKLGKELYKKYPNIKPTSEGYSRQFAKISFALMIKQGLTQSDLASLANVDVQEIYRLQGGSKYMGDEFYNNVFKVLGTTLNECREMAKQMEEY